MITMSVKNLNFLSIKYVLYFLFVAVSSDNNEANKKNYDGLISSSRDILRRHIFLPSFLDEVADFIPESFDARENWPQCPSIAKVEDQDDCNSMAVATAGALTDRWCISSNGSDQFEFSAGDILTCCSLCGAGLPWFNDTFQSCELFPGGIRFGIDYWIDEGVVSGSGRGLMKGCKPYSTIVQKGSVSRAAGKCKKKCTNHDYRIPYGKDKRSGVDYSLWSYNNDLHQTEKSLQTEIMNYGPVLTTLNSTKDFVENGGRGIYRVPKEKPRDGEVTKIAVKIIGWGTEDGRSYWLLANTRGPKWGAEKGFFKLLRGINHLGVEEKVYAPDVKKRQYTKNTNEDLTRRPWIYSPTPTPRNKFSAGSILDSVVTFYFIIFNMFVSF